MTTTISALEVGNRVCRRSCRDHKIVGTVLSIGSTHARVQWDRSQMGLVRLSNGKSQSSSIRLSELVLESEFQQRHIDRPEEDAYKPTLIRVDVQDGSGVCEYGRNAWAFAADREQEALATARAIASEGKRVKVSRREVATVTPKGCRRPREFSRWVSVSF